MSEFYFDVKLKRKQTVNGLSQLVDVSKSDKSAPKLYVERDYTNQNLNYVLYMVFPQLNSRSEMASEEGRTLLNVVDRSNLVYKEIVLTYDRCGVDLNTMEKLENDPLPNSVEVKKKSINLLVDDNQYVKDGCRLNISTNDQDISGVGKVVLKSQAKEDEIYYFAVNFGFKRKISYLVSGNKIKFICNDVKGRIPVKIVFGERFPCLKEDAESISCQREFLDFDADHSSVMVNLDTDKLKQNGSKIHVTFDEAAFNTGNERIDFNHFYMLECLQNRSLKLKLAEHRRPVSKQFCPYCHKPLVASKSKNGGIGCQGHKEILVTKSGETVKTSVVIKDVNDKFVDNAVFCEEDFSQVKADGKMAFGRLLPANYISNRNYKIAVLGSNRAGKTTFISRFFNIGGDLSTDSLILQNGVAEVFAKAVAQNDDGKKNKKSMIPEVNAAKIDNIELKGGIYKKDGKADWRVVAKNFYERYIIDCVKGMYLPATDAQRDKDRGGEGDLFKYPFIMNVNDGQHYISFYDIAGEDMRTTYGAQRLIPDNTPVGIFYLISGDRKSRTETEAQQANENLQALLKAANPKNCPIAVIVSKFDNLEQVFDENCHCLRSDLKEMALSSSTLEGSLLECNINFASAEIESYLTKYNIDPFTAADKDKYNIKYFSMTSFSSPDAVEAEKHGTVDMGSYLKFKCSPKRMELPFVWMLRQFGCIS